MTPDIPLRDPTVYGLRANAFQGARTYRITDDALTWEEPGKPIDGVFFDDIAEVQMTYAPTRVARNRYRTRVVFRQGGMIELLNTEYVGFANFAEKNEEYSAFVRELHHRLAARGSKAVFRKGSSAAAYFGNLLLTAFIFAMIAIAFVLLLSVGFLWIAIVKLAIVLFFVPTLLRYMRRSTPATYDPSSLPADALPDVQRP